MTKHVELRIRNVRDGNWESVDNDLIFLTKESKLANAMYGWCLNMIIVEKIDKTYKEHMEDAIALFIEDRRTIDRSMVMRIQRNAMASVIELGSLTHSIWCYMPNTFSPLTSWMLGVLTCLDLYRELAQVLGERSLLST